jgi:membrane-associated HD superfamily phosphohydrolase
MLPNIPFYLELTFYLSLIFCILMLLVASRFNKKLATGFVILIALQGILAYSGFYQGIVVSPQRIVFLVPPAFIVILILFVTVSGRTFISSLNIRTLTLLHLVRIPIEFCLLWLFLADAIPQLMTFEGRNFDILAGLSAPVIYYLYFIRKSLSTKAFKIWNYLCILLLVNIVVNALLSAPLPIQQFAFEQPNMGIFYFPFVWLPTVIVPVVFFSHFAILWQLKKKPNIQPD